MVLNRIELGNLLLKNNKGTQFYHTPTRTWIFSFGDSFKFSSRKFTDEEVKELIKLMDDESSDDWF